MKRTLMSLGILLFIIFGGIFIIRFLQNGDFYIVEFIGGMIGIIILLISLLMSKTNHNDNSYK